jgi:hypothetical protein
METTGQTLDSRKTRLEEKDPVLTLLSEISASLKDLNLTFKDHAERLAKLEGQKSGGESSSRDDGISEQREGDDGPIQTQSAHQNPEALGSSESLISNPITQKPQTPEEQMDDFIEVKYGTFPPWEAYNRRYQWVLRRAAPQLNLWGNQDYLSWLKEKRLVFPDDGRYHFPFDLTALARSSDLNAAHQEIDPMEKFCRDLRKRGGFFFFRESDMQGGNKIWSGSDIFTLSDDVPLLFAHGRQTERERLEGFIYPDDPYSEPSTFYKHNAIRDRRYWQIKAPFRRLW